MRAVKIEAFLQEKESVHWIVEDLLPDVGWTLFYGLKGIGKTTFAIQLCEAIQTGVPFLGRRTKKTRILYIQADSQVLEWREILKRVSPSNKGFTVVDVPDGCLRNDSYISALVNYVQVIKPGFVVWDSLYNLASDDNINNPKVLQTVRRMTDICKGLPWLLVHHPPHGESRAAGSSALGNACSNEWCLLNTKLRIDKGRLVADKEILLRRAGKENGGLWSLHTAKQLSGSSFYDREV